MSHVPRITLFGASGFLGRHIVRALAPTGSVMRVPTRDPEKALVLKPLGDVGQIVPIATRLDSDHAVRLAIGQGDKAADTVINLTGILFEKHKDDFRTVHVELAARIARLAKEAGAKRLIHISALGVDALSPSSYSRSKAEGEAAVRAFFPDVTILRPSVVFGPEDNFFNMFSSMARFSPFLPLIGGGLTRFQPVYVGDVAAAVAAVLAKPETKGKFFELAGPQVYTFRELMEAMMAVTGRRRPLLPIPWSVAMLQAAVLEQLPNPPLTRDQVKLLRTDNVLHGQTAKTLRDLGINPTALEVILPTYLQRFRPVRTQPLSA